MRIETDIFVNNYFPKLNENDLDVDEYIETEIDWNLVSEKSRYIDLYV